MRKIPLIVGDWLLSFPEWQRHSIMQNTAIVQARLDGEDDLTLSKRVGYYRLAGESKIISVPSGSIVRFSEKLEIIENFDYGLDLGKCPGYIRNKRRAVLLGRDEPWSYQFSDTRRRTIAALHKNIISSWLSIGNTFPIACKVKWLPVDQRFRIRCEDGFEWIENINIPEGWVPINGTTKSN